MSLSKRGQVTLFIILGIVIFGIILFMLFIYSSAQKSVSTKDTENVAKELQRYVDELVREKTIEGFRLLASQGFKIYRDVAPGCNVQVTNIQQDGNSNYCPYSGLSNSLIPVLIDSSLEDYHEESHLHFTNLNNVYGTAHLLPPLEDVSNQNQEAIANQINSYIGNKLRRELNTALDSFFSEKRGYRFSITKYPAISTKIEDRITVNVSYDIGVEKAQQRSNISKSVIQIEYNFPKIYNFVKDVINFDARRLNYDITTGSQDFEVRIPLRQVNYNIIEVRDLRNQFEGEDYIVKFARRNRAPDANSISIQGREREGDARTLGRDEGIFYEGGTLTLRCNPNADPDEEPQSSLRYEISGKGSFVNKWTINPSGCEPYSGVFLDTVYNERGSRIGSNSPVGCGASVNTIAADVGDEVSIRIIDSNNLRDNITFIPVKCNLDNPRCATDGKWKIGDPANCETQLVVTSVGNCDVLDCPPNTPPEEQQSCPTRTESCCGSRESVPYKKFVDENGECILSNQPA